MALTIEHIPCDHATAGEIVERIVLNVRSRLTVDSWSDAKAPTEVRPTWIAVDVGIVEDPTILAIGHGIRGPQQNELVNVSLTRCRADVLAEVIVTLQASGTIPIELALDRTGIGLPVALAIEAITGAPA